MKIVMFSLVFVASSIIVTSVWFIYFTLFKRNKIIFDYNKKFNKITKLKDEIAKR